MSHWAGCWRRGDKALWWGRTWARRAAEASAKDLPPARRAEAGDAGGAGVMDMDILERYRRGELPIPQKQWAWFLYGAGLENLGRDGKPELIDVPQIGPDELLARVDCCGICFSDVKIVNLGPDHPRLFGRNLKQDPIIMGHEVALTIVRVGEQLQDQYKVGDRFVVQADIYYRGVNLAFGYMLYGGYEQFVKLGDEVLRGDEGCYLIPVKNPEVGYAEAALSEPWACVVCSYRWMHRRQIKEGGVMWVVGLPDAAGRQFSLGQISKWPGPARLIMTDVPDSLAEELKKAAQAWGARVCKTPPLGQVKPADVLELYAEGAGIDDLIILGASQPDKIAALSAHLAREGIAVIVSPEGPPGPVSVDVGRVHYDQIRFLGCPGPDISEAYTRSRDPALKGGGKFWVIGAGGPMGQMHVQWAIEQEQPPQLIVASDIDRDRLALLAARFSAPAQARGIELVCLNPKELGEEATEAKLRELAPEGFDDICVLVPVSAIIADAARHLGQEGMLNIFAGVARGTMADIDLTPFIGKFARMQGTSGSDIEDLELTLRLAEEGKLNTNMAVAAISGIDGVKEGLQAVVDARFPGKTVVYPHVEGLGVVGLAELEAQLPQVAEKLAPGHVWTREAEAELLRKFLPNKY